MNDQSPTNDPLSPQKPSLSSDALMRRRLMLRGASSGVAALAALQPVGALATTSTVITCFDGNGKETLCTVSGVQSGTHSFGPNISKISASGKAKSYWAALANWPSGCASSCAPGTFVGTLLSGASGSVSGLTMRELLNNSKVAKSSETIEADFVCAYLNGTALYAASPTTTLSFPYSSAQVLTLWKDPLNRTKAQALFKSICKLTS